MKKKEKEERMWLKRMAVAAVRRVRLEGGDEETEEVEAEGEKWRGGSQGGTRAMEGRVGVILC